jgi:CDP-paratose 2-epimerase
VLSKQLAAPRLSAGDRVTNFSGGAASARSLRQLTDWCAARFGPHNVASDPSSRPFDIPWMILDSAKAERLWQWRPQTPVDAILEEIATHAQAHPGWLDISAPL